MKRSLNTFAGYGGGEGYRRISPILGCSSAEKPCQKVEIDITVLPLP